MFVRRNEPRLSPSAVEQKMQRVKQNVGFCREVERDEQITLFLVRFYNCRQQFVPFALFSIIIL